MNTLLAFTLTALVASKTPAADYVLGTSDVRAERSFSLADRYPNPSVNEVFKFNILHTLDRMSPTYNFTLQPGAVFAFHDTTIPEYKGKVTQTMNAHFNWNEGFKSDGWLVGDGVCHLASLMYQAARDAGLGTAAPTNHNFANIPEVPKEYGVSIFSGNAQQNLYIENTFDKPVEFAFAFDGTNLTVKVID